MSNSSNHADQLRPKSSRLLLGLLFPAILCGNPPTTVAEPAHPASPVREKHVHGIGKQAYDCNFDVVSIRVDDEMPVNRKLSELMVYDVVEYTDPAARRIRQQVDKVYPVSLLVDEYADAGARKILFESCEGGDRKLVDSRDIRENPRQYLLAYNRMHRPRLVMLSAPEGARARYHTVVRNLARITLMR